MKIQAYQSGSLAESIVAFMQYARSHGLNVGIQETKDALYAASIGLINNREQFRMALRPICCTTPEEQHLFDQLFILYWDTNPIDLEQGRSKTEIQGSFNKKSNASLVMLGMGQNENSIEEAKNVSGAHSSERLKKIDLSQLNTIEADELEEIAKKLCKQMAVRMRRRMKQHLQKGLIHMRRTIRKNIAYGGEPVDLYFRLQTPKKQRLVVMLDVSGSMDKYSFFLLRFICALREHFRQLEAFVFSTSLQRITRSLEPKKLDDVLNQISSKTDIWSSGTRIGECLQQFNDKYGKRMMNGSPLVIILSDGLDTGDEKVLAEEMHKIHLRSKRLVWLNPLKGMKGYAPLAKGMKAAMPSIDDFRSAHNLDSLLELENILIHA